ncbi:MULTISPECIES: carbamoyl-phosphate synthase large subunit [Moraxella]|uniref:Carbamoyl phosphate synthase large chain n=1 Tax=Moraxella lacunata TaxID=477 RepID=A0A1B8PVN0_MORLA|nr:MULTISPECIES: carbamoyl-phosphate synthase large subunit [Moraxella]MBE9579730.1 carbamoyl-phosphate synthase large subunit [Moraxella sp. K1664]MBE9589063.1 carbamoyl-phosphate synthase large subunit [Moraxella sp. K1630]MBE9590798.1 carbamoyl-phosphate synthase large subunit [Moraxella sp. K127]MBE9597333.1 carbamoyl-phosphate synthase large subunit [Moraxella sp. K2450]MDH9219891.1 carbamoyl-phosphate synthase large subunit [Moraxella lacunata]
MPKRTDIKSILIIGAGPIVIGQACEFDYSGAQACKALKEEGYRVILVNSNPATIMTDPSMADATYIEPITWQTVAKIIEKERPDAVLPTMGGQTALNCALALDANGVLKQYGCELIGATKEAIEKAEDRNLFDKAMKKIGLECPKADIAETMEQALEIQSRFGFPVIIRPSFTMGGSGGGIAYNKEEFLEICQRGFDLSPTHQLLIDESLIGWKEYEMEVVRDKNDNCIIVCSIENFDPMGVHTGDSITVAPAQTLTDKEYQLMRNASIAVLREIGVETGGSNVQFGINPKDGRMVVIEMNPRVSRSSALASKATGFPIAKIAAKLAVGYTLDELKNDITGGVTPASFEPSIDYVVTKIPRFNFEKFPQAEPVLTTQMKSVGEVMAIGRNFQESMQKALRGLETGATGFDEVMNLENKSANAIVSEIKNRLSIPTPERIFYLAEAFRHGFSLDEVFELTKIDRWFLVQIEDIIKTENEIKTLGFGDLTAENIRTFKRKGMSDLRIANLMGISQKQFRKQRWNLGVYPIYKRVDTCAGEFASNTAYMYSSYDDECEACPTDKDKIMVIGGGPNRIGQGIEFDYCCVHAALAMREDGYETIMVNCNPETVSTDYDTSDRLYFEPITLEDVLEIVRTENPKGVIVQYGGQTPLKLARSLEEAGVPIIGTSPDAIDRAEDRERFQQMINKLNLRQPNNSIVKSSEEGIREAVKVGYPLVVRPSYVLGGRAMEIVYNEDELKRYLREAVQASNEAPVLLDRFLDDAIEVDVDCVSDGKDVVIGGIMQHIEQAGVHSGDSACSIPPYSLGQDIQDEMRRQTIAMAKELGVVGLMNVQFAVKGDEIYILEVNPRASRTVPFVSKCIGTSLAKVAARCMAGQTLAEQNFVSEIVPKHFSVKEAVFPFAKFQGVDPILGPEMKSTGEVMGVGQTFGEAYYKATLGSGDRLTGLPQDGETKTVFISVRDSDKAGVVDVAKRLAGFGFNIVATGGTHDVLTDAGVACERVNKVSEGRPHIVDMMKNGQIHLAINTTEGKQALEDSFPIRREALQNKVLIATTLNAGRAVCEAYETTLPFNVYKLQEL